uniref:Uncharacterized protein n=1 Tax=Rhizophora mucronata TaxID=61149 RepID=A0A2P2P2J4_RHIMU
MAMGCRCSFLFILFNSVLTTGLIMVWPIVHSQKCFLGDAHLLGTLCLLNECDIFPTLKMGLEANGA